MPLVQLVERRFPKPNVVGSSPTGHVFEPLRGYRNLPELRSGYPNGVRVFPAKASQAYFFLN